MNDDGLLRNTGEGAGAAAALPFGLPPRDPRGQRRDAGSWYMTRLIAPPEHSLVFVLDAPEGPVTPVPSAGCRAPLDGPWYPRLSENRTPRSELAWIGLFVPGSLNSGMG